MLEKTKKEKEDSRNRGPTDREEEQSGVMERVCTEDKTRTKEKPVLFAQSNTEKVRSEQSTSDTATAPTQMSREQCSWHEIELHWTVSLKSPQMLCRGLEFADHKPSSLVTGLQKKGVTSGNISSCSDCRGGDYPV